MRFGVGLAILGVSVVGLGWWARVEYAPHVQSSLARAADVIASGAVHGVVPHVDGRDIRVTGLADGPQERAALVAQFRTIQGWRIFVDDLEVLAVEAPFSVAATWQDGVLSANGFAPTQPEQSALEELGAQGLTLAAGAPDRQWARAATTGIEALKRLEAGEMALSDRLMMVTGTARTPAEGEAIRAELDGLPDGYQAELVLGFSDDGTPPAYALHYSVALGAWVEGKLPPGLTVDVLSAATGLEEIENRATQGLMGEPGVPHEVLGLLRPWLASFETMDVAVSPEGTDLAVGFGAGADLSLIRAALEEHLQGSVTSLDVESVVADGSSGAFRTNPITGQEQELRRGYWLPIEGFDPDIETCTARVDDVLATNRIGFVTGSAQLDAYATASVNALASVLDLCVQDAGLLAEIEGHTDNTGDAGSNLTLSRARAEAVRVALIDRAVPEGSLTAAGFGADSPVAGNESAEGRAANRRIEIRWIE